MTVRKPPFTFRQGGTPFMWNPGNPYFAVTGNMMSFMAPAFERYLVRATRDAIPLMRDPAVVEEAELFLRQEAVHSRMHALHARSLVEQYPGLAVIQPEIERRYAALYDSRPLAFHVAYAADVEATFTPLFNTLLRNRGSLFEGGDSMVASLLMWHFVEEIEHRSSAYNIYNAVVPDRWYRLWMMPSVLAHLVSCTDFIYRCFDEMVPEADRVVTAAHLSTGFDGIAGRLRSRLPLRLGGSGKPRHPGQLHGVSAKEKAQLLYRLVLSQNPMHSPEHEECPPFALEWMDEFDRGRNVADWYGGSR